ncbi:hypothetical protein [Kribbella speibonae]|uniref:hypothetical protein n=1 Tax=Kribbella speibonae TaxID=1572660 RepID=UPI00192DFFFD|nr:hypothetical protein [Kribbella speibonae]
MQVEVQELGRDALDAPRRGGEDRADDHQLGIVVGPDRGLALPGEATVQDGGRPAGRGGVRIEADRTAADADALDQVRVVVDPRPAVADVQVEVLQ